MNIVLDTNVLVAGLLSPHGICAEIVRMITSGEPVICYDARILDEYAEVLYRPKFKLDKDKVAALLDYLEHRGCVVASRPLLRSLPDIDDNPFLEISLAGGAACLVTGNKQHYPSNLRQRIKVLSPREFLDFYKTSKP